jgi:hypothetical protein
MCPFATAGCMRDCLFTAGRGIFQEIKNSRIAKTKFLLDDRAAFLASMRYIRKLVTQAAKLGLQAAVRINGTSDQPWIALQMASEFPHVQFYDYTKIPRPWRRIRPNYHLTFSRSESNAADCLAALRHSINVAVVFDTYRGEPLPSSWHGFRVVDGDVHDLRFLDSPGVVVVLRAKGQARNDEISGFVVAASPTLRLSTNTVKLGNGYAYTSRKSETPRRCRRTGSRCPRGTRAISRY